MSDQIDTVLTGLRREYLAAMPERVEELRADITAWRGGSAEATPSLRGRFHKLAGSGGAYAFTDLSAIAREGARWLASPFSYSGLDGLSAIVARLAGAVEAAQKQLPAA